MPRDMYGTQPKVLLLLLIAGWLAGYVKPSQLEL